MTTSRTTTLPDDPIAEYVDLERYPIADLKSPAARAGAAGLAHRPGRLGVHCGSYRPASHRDERPDGPRPNSGFQ